MIYGIGIDIVHIPKFKKTIEKWGDRFKNRIFTQNELAYCEEKRFSEQHLAARFAAKEAFIKALGKGIPFTDIEVLNNQDGKPCIVFKPKGLSYLPPVPLWGQISNLSPEKGIKVEVTQGFSLDNPQSAIRNFKTHLTLSHDGDYCVAQVILEIDKEIL